MSSHLEDSEDGKTRWLQSSNQISRKTVLSSSLGINLKLMVNLEEKENSQIRYLQQGNQQLIQKSSDCNWLTKYMTNNLYNTHLELSFPVAYSVFVQDNFQQFFHLFRILYRPQNVYCVHPYKKTVSSARFLFNLANCFNNIMVTKQLVDGNWSDYTSLDAQMQCLSDLMDYQEK